MVTLPNAWSPRSYQQPLWRYMSGGGKRAVAVWHRRAGKDDVALHWAAVASQLRVGTYWHMLPEAAQSRKAIWEAVDPHTARRRIDTAFPKSIRSRTLNNEMFLELRNGSTWQVLGSDNYDSLVGSPPIGVVFSEYALANPHSWAYIRPILKENGGWAMFISTPRGRNHLHKIHQAFDMDPEAFAEVLPVTKTTVFDERSIEKERSEYWVEYGKIEGEALFQQEYHCSFEAAIVGAYYTQEIADARAEKRITRVPVDPYLPVDTCWDLGKRDATAIWFIQRSGGMIHVVGHYEAHGVDLTHYARYLRSWQEQHGIRYGMHYFPHDLNQDILLVGKSRIQSLYDLGVAPIFVVPVHMKIERIHAMRRMFRYCLFDAEACEHGLEALAMYHAEYDEKRKAFVSVEPKHDWTSHSADAIGIYAAQWDHRPLPSHEARKRYFRDTIQHGTHMSE